MNANIRQCSMYSCGLCCDPVLQHRNQRTRSCNAIDARCCSTRNAQIGGKLLKPGKTWFCTKCSDPFISVQDHIPNPQGSSLHPVSTQHNQPYQKNLSKEFCIQKNVCPKNFGHKNMWPNKIYVKYNFDHKKIWYKTSTKFV